jgi:uncharacterized protein YbjT (DUF2867 family)
MRPREQIMILVTGANGTAGKAVVDAIRKVEARYVGMVRSKPKSSEVAADFADKAGMKKVLGGIDTVFLVCSPIPQLVELEGNVIGACVAVGVKHVVLNSALGAGDYPTSFPSWHRQVEEKLKASGLAYTILRPNSFHQNILAYLAPVIREQGAFYAAAHGGRFSFVDVRDIGAAAANVLISPSAHAGKIYELNGPEAVTYSELADRISRAAGRTVRYVDIPEEAQRQAMAGTGMPAWQVDALLDLQRYYVNGQGGEVTDVLPSLLGRPPLTLDQFLTEHADNFQ